MGLPLRESPKQTPLFKICVEWCFLLSNVSWKLASLNLGWPFVGFSFPFRSCGFRFMTLEFVSCGACHIDDGTEEYHPLCLHPRIPSPHIIALLFDHSHVTDCSVDQTTQTTVNGPKQQTTNIRKFSRLCLTQNFFECS